MKDSLERLGRDDNSTRAAMAEVSDVFLQFKLVANVFQTLVEILRSTIVRIRTQEKIIMTPFERDWGISPGGPLRVFETAIGNIAVAICYDCEFPLLTRALTEAGAEILLVPSCTEKISGYHRVRTGTKARALENTIAAVQSPTVGDAPWSPAIDFNAGFRTGQ